MLRVMYALQLLAVSSIVVACGASYVDDDNKYDLARQVIPDMQVSDSIDVEIGDRKDFKKITPLFDGEVTLEITVGDPFAGRHRLTGEVGVYTTRPKLLDKKGISPDKPRYTLTFEAEANVSYVFTIEGVSGKASYSIDYSQKVAPVDPCANVSCQEGQQCQEGQCVAIATDTPPDPPEDLRACPNGCPRSHFCSKKKRRCLKRPCFGVKCKKGFYCKAGKCKRKAVRPIAKPKGCKAGCKKGFYCKAGKCIRKAPTGNVVAPSGNTGPISASVIQVQPKGSKSLVLLGRGKVHNVKIGDKGTIGGLSFKVIKVFARRCRARVNAPASKLAGTKRARIVRR